MKLRLHWSAGAAIAAALALPVPASAAWLPSQTLTQAVDPNYPPELVMAPGGALGAAWRAGDGALSLTYRAPGAAADSDPIDMTGLQNPSGNDIAINADGDAIAVFEAKPADANYSRIFAVTRGAGDAAWSAPQPVSPELSEQAAAADVAIDGEGNALVVWNAGHLGGPVKSVYRHADGTLEAAQEIRGAGDTPVYGNSPTVAVDGAGRGTVAFTDTAVKVATRSAGASGTWSAAEVVDSGSYMTISELSVQANAAGDALVSWAYVPSYWARELRAIHRDALDTDFGDVKVVGGDSAWYAGNVALDGGGDAVALWFGSTDGTQGATYDEAADTWSPDPSVDSEILGNGLTVGVGAGGDAVATWYESAGYSASVKAMRRSAGGWSAPENVVSGVYSAYRPRVAVDDQGSAAALWFNVGQSSDPYALKLRIDDHGVPAAGAIDVPATVQVGEAADMSAAFTDRFSDVTVDWDFGDGDSDTGSSVEHTYDELGEQTVTITATDAAGNAAAPVTRTVDVVDTVDPQTSITDAPAGSVDDDPVSLTFGGTDNSGGALTFECSVDGGAPQACSSPYELAGLAEGERTVTVAAIDASGNKDETPASATFTVDRTAPGTTITGAPIGPTSLAAPQVTFSSDDPSATFECSVAGGAFAACESPKALSGLGEGSHAFAVRAVDAAGNADGTPAQTTVVVDRTAPSPSITAPGNGARTTDTTPVLSGTGGRAAGDDPVVSYGVWAGDGLTEAPVAHGDATVSSSGTWSVTLPELPLGSYTAAVCQYDAAVNYRFPCPQVRFEVVAPAPPAAVQQPAPVVKSTPPAPAPVIGGDERPKPAVTLGQTVARAATAYTGAFSRLGITGLLSRTIPPMPFQAPGPGKARIDLLAPTAKASAAAAKRKKAKPVVVATGAKAIAAAGSTQIRVKLTAKGRRLLEKQRSIRLTLKTSFTPTGGEATSVTRTVTLKKKKIRK